MKTLKIYYQLVGDCDETVHIIHYGYYFMINEDNINDAVIRHSNGNQIRRAWW